MTTKIGVIESKWGQKGNGISKNTTVRPLFDFISDLHFGNHHAYEYELVGNRSAFRDAFRRQANSRAVSFVYIAMHGSADGLHLHGGEKITRTILKNDLLEVDQSNGANITGLFLGSCMFGSHALADFLFKNDCRLTWIAGYEDSVDFVSSSGLDMLFFNTLISVRESNPRQSNLHKIKEVARRMKIQMQGLCNTSLENCDPHCGLGFSIFIRKTGRTKGAMDLMRG